jgi:hypothetical protein
MQTTTDPDVSAQGAADRSPAAADHTEAPDRLLTREQTAAALTAEGFPVRAKTLSTKATRGGGPPYALFSGRALYRWGDALDWARGLMTPPRRSTSEADTKRGAI